MKPIEMDFIPRKSLRLYYHFGVYTKSGKYPITGVGLNDFINISRITAAEKLLVSSNMSITEIASACGFNDSNYFASVFKKFKGITPKRYSLINK